MNLENKIKQTESSEPIEAYKKSYSYKKPITWYPESAYKKLEEENSNLKNQIDTLKERSIPDCDNCDIEKNNKETREQFLKLHAENGTYMVKLEEEIKDLKTAYKMLGTKNDIEKGFVARYEKENIDLKNQLLKLSDENNKLGHDYKMFKNMYEETKKQLDGVKYLDENEVIKVFDNYANLIRIVPIAYVNLIKDICSLATPEINKNKTIKVLKKFFGNRNMPIGIEIKTLKEFEKYLEQIADEILKE